MLQLNPPIPVYIPEVERKGYALGWIDYSQEHDLIWIVALDNSEVWLYENPRVRVQWNQTLGRTANTSSGAK